MATIKKAQDGYKSNPYATANQVNKANKAKKPVVKMENKKPKSVSERIGNITLRDVKNAGEDALNLATVGLYSRGKRALGGKYRGKKDGGKVTKAKMGASIKKAKSGFAALAPPFDKATFADKIAGATKNKAKSGTKIKKAMMGTMAKPMMKSGGSMKKCKYGCK